MLFMVIETFKNHDLKAVYQRFAERGRMMPTGLTYISSWVEASGGRCFQLMETDNVALLQEWIAQWQELVSFEVIPVCPGKDTAAAIMPLLSQNALAK